MVASCHTLTIIPKEARSNCYRAYSRASCWCCLRTDNVRMCRRPPQNLLASVQRSRLRRKGPINGKQGSAIPTQSADCGLQHPYLWTRNPTPRGLSRLAASVPTAPEP
ncbi:ORF15 [Fowl aviadenovirus A]|uniref:ORF15 n=1 Tax=Fowl aviadenovirus A TaxID=190061 RepID=A0A1L5YQL4_9ADEN|nr:hypothetical protein [Fowl aviadenovirus A]APP94083.1 hypothetical protein [Fowl aviadenovirus A]AZI71467.1 ORF15 [Fowl aviadenovirus A]QGQ62248.1 ORF15 [Fowl aviadenovirus A]QGQ62282.1 ORF15 [Fowl aviadenovirus A]